MHQQRENLDILFRKTTPEMALRHIRGFGCVRKCESFEAGIEKYTKNLYEHYAPWNLREYTPDEIEIRYQALSEEMMKSNNGLLFNVLVEYAKEIIKISGLEPVCRLEKILDWNSMTKRLGQDIFTTSLLAYNDVMGGRNSQWNFAWPAVIKSDDKKLNRMFQKGLAENHFHLNGSTQVFSLSWVCLMNHPGYIATFLKKAGAFEENLSVGISRGPMDNVMTWLERLRYAAMIRCILTRRCLGELSDIEVWSEFLEFDNAIDFGMLQRKVEVLRRYYGVEFEQPDGKYKCLDYANCQDFYQVDSQLLNRLLAGERAFLYQCFKMIFRGAFTLQESSLLYLYLLIKSNFAGELIQNNGRPGFKNFSDYQDRKSECFGRFKEYVVEAYRLAIRAAIEENNVMSLEARIMPKMTVREMKGIVDQIDAMTYFADEKRAEWPYYYVIHFPKAKFEKKEYSSHPGLLLPRNWKIRNKAKCGAIKLSKYIQNFEMIKKCEDDKQRILGIDACSREIGCRPETFATEFRFLRETSKYDRQVEWYREKRQDYVNLGITYHVGEDYLDIVDGLRAIDEAILFLKLEKGDRLGHAIALGLDANVYYTLKRWSVYLPAQDYLDNLVWILYRSLELNIAIDANYRSLLTERARDLLIEIYGDENGNLPRVIAEHSGEILDIYYYSWKLRADHPDLYRSGLYDDKMVKSWIPYERYKKGDDRLDKYRKIKSVCYFYYLYHFDSEVKNRGLKASNVEWENWKWYVDLVTEMQEKLRIEVARKGIAIECNPTSNVLISTFANYSQHPILKFNCHHLELENQTPDIQVSINTDDLGVFDTSLENEYALLLCALKRARNNAGVFNDEPIYDYLDYLRECGINMSFRVK